MKNFNCPANSCWRGFFLCDIPDRPTKKTALLSALSLVGSITHNFGNALFLLLLSFPVLFMVPFFFHGSLLLFFLQFFDVFIPFLNLLLLVQARRVQLLSFSSRPAGTSVFQPFFSPLLQPEGEVSPCPLPFPFAKVHVAVRVQDLNSTHKCNALVGEKMS